MDVQIVNLLLQHSYVILVWEVKLLEEMTLHKIVLVRMDIMMFNQEFVNVLF